MDKTCAECARLLLAYKGKLEDLSACSAGITEAAKRGDAAYMDGWDNVEQARLDAEVAYGAFRAHILQHQTSTPG